MRADPFLVRLMFGGLLKPKNEILGADLAGRVEAVGSNVKQFQPGDEVFGDLSGCGFGAFAEYVSVPENALVLKPASATFEETAAVPLAALAALQGLRDKGQIRPGQKVLINGASCTKSKGIYVMVGGSTVRMFQMMFPGPWISMTGSKKMHFLVSKPNQEDLVVLKDLIEAGKGSREGRTGH